MSLLRRGSSWGNRFARCWEQLGLANTLRIFLWSRMGGGRGLSRIKLPDGRSFNFQGKLDSGVLSHFYSVGYRLHDSDTQPILRIVDAGANIGDETARFLYFHPRARIAAVEPSDRNFELLQKNFAGCSNVKLFKGALWPVNTRLRIEPGENMEAFKVFEAQPDDAQAGLVPTFTVNELMREMGWDGIDVLKLDIEGAEFELFTRNEAGWINKVKVLIFEIPDSDRAGATQAIFRALNAHNFSSFICGENLVLIRADAPWRLEHVTGFAK